MEGSTPFRPMGRNSQGEHFSWRILGDVMHLMMKRLEAAQDFWLDCRDAARANPDDAKAQRMLDVDYAKGFLHGLELEWALVRDTPANPRDAALYRRLEAERASRQA